MILEFPYLPVPIVGDRPPTLSPLASARWKPIVPIRVAKPGADFRDFDRALIDTGADDTVFPAALVDILGIDLLPDSHHQIRWHGNAYPIRYGSVQFQLNTPEGNLCWNATIAFSAARLRYPLLGQAGFLQYFDVAFSGCDHLLQLEPNREFAMVAVEP